MTLRQTSRGFTLLELVLAMLIASLVMGILSVALGFSLRVWERQLNRKASDMPAMIDHLKWQLASLNPIPVRTDMESRIIFIGQEHVLTFATDHSVRSLSRGVPVVARYLFKPSEKKLYYAEIPFDPYHSEPIEEFMQLEPGQKKTWPQFHATDTDEFALSFGKGDGASEREWNEEMEAPLEVGVRWRDGETEGRLAVILPNFFFPRTSDQDTARIGLGRKRER